MNFGVRPRALRYRAEIVGSQRLPITTAPSVSGIYLSATSHAISKALARRHLQTSSRSTFESASSPPGPWYLMISTRRSKSVWPSPRFAASMSTSPNNTETKHEDHHPNSYGERGPPPPKRPHPTGQPNRQNPNLEGNHPRDLSDAHPDTSRSSEVANDRGNSE